MKAITLSGFARVLIASDPSLKVRDMLAACVVRLSFYLLYVRIAPRDRYELINIKLDKTGGLTEALALADAAEALEFGLFLGCMVGSSLAMAPAMILAARARFVDLDGPLLLAADRQPGLVYEGSFVYPPTPALWG